MDNVDRPFKAYSHKEPRQERDEKIVTIPDQIRRIDNHTYKVKSQSRNIEHYVISTESGRSCDCEDHKFHKVCCMHDDLQRYICKSCGKRFSINLDFFEKMKANPQTIIGAMQLYFTGESLRNVQKFLQLQGVEVSYVIIYRWIDKYVWLLHKYLKPHMRLEGKTLSEMAGIKVEGDNN